MDPITLIYYATICGLLSVAVTKVRAPVLRFCAGVAVGLIAAGVLPILRRQLSFD